MSPGEASPETVAILAPLGRDAEIAARLLREAGMATLICPDLGAILPALQTCGLALLTEEALQAGDLGPLAERIEQQPEWSDFPFVLLTSRGGGIERNPAAMRHMRVLGNVTLLERPFHPMTLVSAARTALASRRRQYQARDRLTALEASRSELERSDERLRFALEAGKLGAWEFDLSDRSLHASDLCKRQFGVGPEEDFTYDRAMALIHPNDRERVQKAAADAIATRADHEIEYRIVTPAGETRWLEIRGRGTQDTDGANQRLAGVSLDITARKEASERQQLLIRELHHRVKNTLSTVQAIVGSTARGARSIEDFTRDFTGRILSLANTHTILTEELWQRASLHELLSKELSFYDDGNGRIRVGGPEIELPSDYAVPLGMAFHELTTNAAKYGALSNGRGSLRVEWSVAHDGRVSLDWVETGGPPVTPPTRHGFGTRLLDRVLTAQVQAQVGLDFDPAGVRLSLAFQLPEPRTGSLRTPS